ncbi:hypothetical protein [Mesorhizobium dulcispinae]|uniref:hypothetical protein n=1 Tax=Mesorhizobium dulcispinae TaxID=3072316 RepID=UPI002A2412D2|nr:hypothetical protein [Mesorhizobium sp. VK23D]MDX8519814.1 hypothetical protein [Mesorhizobium sp. VK23D]
MPISSDRISRNSAWALSPESGLSPTLAPEAVVSAFIVPLEHRYRCDRREKRVRRAKVPLEQFQEKCETVFRPELR